MRSGSEPGGRARRAGRSIVLVAALLSAVTAYLIAATVAAQGRTTTTTMAANSSASQSSVTWDGKKGAEYADQSNCSQGAYWLWILTPGGNKLQSATLTVTFASGASETVTGYFPGNGDGSIHFDVTQAPDTVTGANASFSYIGSKPNNVGLTISHAYCTGNPVPSGSVPATAPATGTSTP